jgi:bifunctional ADP-heptose synthase (sugar kinase/adenylyltransferase)
MTMSKLSPILTSAVVETILEKLPSLRLGVVGDLFLDRYLDLDASLTEPSIETGLDAYQVAGVRSIPGAAGTIVNNLVALCVGRVEVVSIIGDDGEGYELSRAWNGLPAVDSRRVMKIEDRRTPTYTKPMLMQAGLPPRELNRLDIKNRTPTPPDGEAFVLQALADIWPRIDALLVLDQVSEANCGVITERVRHGLAKLGQSQPQKLILADSRRHIGQFRSVSAKPNQSECVGAILGESAAHNLGDCIKDLVKRLERPVFCTCGEEGILVAEPGSGCVPLRVPAYRVQGPVDIVGAGDSTSAGIACALAAAATLPQAAAFGNLVASITIQQIGTTGTANPAQVRQRLRDISCAAL